MSKKSASTATSKVSAPPASSSASSQKSSILKSAFAPSRFQLRLFASVIQSFGSQQLRIHDTSTSHLRCIHQTSPNAKVNCLEWGKYSRSHPKRSKKSKSKPNEDAVVAYGTSQSEICLFSPAEGKLLQTLTGVHEQGVYDFKFSPHRDGEAWSIGGNATLVQWDLNSDKPARTISLPDNTIRYLSPPTNTPRSLLCASSTPYIVNLESSEDAIIEALDSMKNPVHSLYRSGIDGISSTEFALAADTDRYIGIHDLNQKRLVRTLITGAGVQSADFLSTKSEGADTWDSQMLAVVTNDGLVEMFLRPFVPPSSGNGDIKMQRKGLTQKADAKVKLINTGNKSKPIPVASASLQGPELVVATVDGGVDISFQRISWQDEGTGELLFDGTKEVARVKAASSLNSAHTNGVKNVSNAHVDESKTVVVNGIDDPEGQDASQDDAIEISSSDEEEADASDEDEEKPAAPDAEVAHSDVDSDEEMQDAKEIFDDSVLEDGEEKSSAGQPSFGELLASRISQTIDIADAFDSSSTAVATVANGALSLPTGMSLGTVLTQSLRTNDRNLLEACLHTTDLDVVRNTIQRLESSLAGILLSKLTERLSSRPGRYGNLQVWVQQLCIAHGAAISTQPAVKKQVQLLYRVLDQRAKSLSHLMLLKGKLDMLDAQLKFRKQLAAQRALRQDQDGEPGMIYVEGEADNWSSGDDLAEIAGISSKQARVKAPKGKGKALEEFADQEDSEDEDMQLTNGISGSDSEEDEEDEELQLQSGTLVDDEAADEEDSEEEGDDVDSEEEEEDSEEEDSEMDDFIDDNTPEVEDASEDVGVHGKNGENGEDEEKTLRKPPTKKSRHR